MTRSELATSYQGGTYCYIVMPFEKNAGASHQHLVDRMFQKQIGHNMEVYVDDMLGMNHQVDQHITDLAETFSALKKYHLKLNLAKCMFGVRRGKFLGYKVIEKGIEVNLDKVRTI
ncbi:UNVERIFIED_CONTAM: hypothetical protein Slati_0765900 [Sesamum latifolium]|uniref:Reverse transcriptase domain-containing protein n=1 Tax=Sesamum latifolium TaxID=2727402 RepID=A0AAW2XJR9_9LAMI